MKLKKPCTLPVACCALLFVMAAHAQLPTVKILRFEVDGKEVKEDFKITLYANNQIIEPLRVEDGFIVPPEIRSCENVGVRFLSENYDLVFDQVYLSKFDTDWIVGVDNKPFDQEYIEPKEARKLKLIYYLQFVPRRGDETRMVVKVHK